MLVLTIEPFNYTIKSYLVNSVKNSMVLSSLGRCSLVFGHIFFQVLKPKRYCLRNHSKTGKLQKLKMSQKSSLAPGKIIAESFYIFLLLTARNGIHNSPRKALKQGVNTVFFSAKFQISFSKYQTMIFHLMQLKVKLSQSPNWKTRNAQNFQLQ